jgi:hypothetical protein
MAKRRANPQNGSPYDLARWQRRRRAQLQAQPLCQLCLQRGKTTPATTCDHITPWKTWNEFWTSPVQSLCKACHDRVKRHEQRYGYRQGCDERGWPSDPRHPCYTNEPRSRFGGPAGPLEPVHKPYNEQVIENTKENTTQPSIETLIG